MATITRGSVPRLMQEGVHNVFGAEYSSYKPIYSEIYKVLQSKKAYELAVQMEGFGLASVKDEASDIAFDTRQQGFSPKYIHNSYAKGFVISYEALQDELYHQLDSGARAVARAMRISKEVYSAALFNNAFTTASSMPGGDGLAMISTAHINGPSGGTYSNRLPLDADFAEASLEDMCRLINRASDPRGLNINLQTNKLIGHVDQAFDFERVLKSSLQNDTGNNAINAIKNMGYVSGGYVATPYLTADTDAWFVTTDAPDGLKFYQRQEIQFGEDEAFTSMNMRYRAFERYAFGYDDPRGVYGTSGS